MSELLPQPLSFSILWSSGIKQAGVSVENRISHFLLGIVNATELKNKGCLVGHVKAFAQDLSGNYLKISMIDGGIEPEIESTIESFNTDIEVLVNIIIYGVSRDFLIEEISLREKDFKEIKFISFHQSRHDPH